jgi:uncharacterized protein
MRNGHFLTGQNTVGKASIVFAGVGVALALAIGSALPSAADTIDDTVKAAGIAHRKGDYATAFQLYRLTANQGNEEAQCMLGLQYELGQGVKQNYVEAAKWYRLAADQGAAECQHNLAHKYFWGRGVPQSYTEAAKWYRLAAEQGLSASQNELGQLFKTGLGAPQNYAEAIKWFRITAERGDDNGQALLAEMYAQGLGVPRNYLNAYFWLSLSAAQGNKLALHNLEVVAKKMTAAQIAEAQRLAAEWKPTAKNATSPSGPVVKREEDVNAVMSGTAFFVSEDGQALTNAHVVESCRYIVAGGRDAQLFALDKANDLALIGTGLRPARWVRWRLSVRQGEDVIVYGFPLAGVLSSGGNVATGNVTALSGLRDDSRFLQISAPVQPGNSGGPLFDRQGNVVGIVVSKLNALRVASATGDIPQNINFAIKASVAFAFLDAQGVTHSETPTAPQDLSTPEITTRAQAMVTQVVCRQ